MSAICGMVQPRLAPGAIDGVRRMQAALAPYGRHAEAVWDGHDVALGSRLTRLLPEDSHDRQPLSGGGGHLTLVADVRLDNREELGRSLGIAPARLAVLADADVLLLAYERWQHEVTTHLLGDFAFAVWDSRQRSLFMARDHMGRRPLFYHQGRHGFAFASMPVGLLALPGVETAPDESRLRDLLLLMPERDEHSFFAGITRLLPAHAALLDGDGQLRHWCYWQAPLDKRVHCNRDDDYVDGFVEVLEQAVRCRLRSSGGVASMLSAGFDSSTVSSVAARLLGEQPLDVFTSVPNPDGLSADEIRVGDEGPLAAQVAALFPNMRHHRIRSDDTMLSSIFQPMYALYNRPAKNVVNLAWGMEIARQAAARGATTLLGGEMGNFTISYHGGHVLNSLLRDGAWQQLWQQLAHEMRHKNTRQRLGVLHNMLTPSLPENLQWLLARLEHQLRGFPPLATGINPALLADKALQQAYHARRQRIGIRNQFDESRRWRQQLLLRHDVAEYGKGTLAQSGMDKRDPTADVRLIEYCQSLPVRQFNHHGQDRWLLRRALRRYWPEDVIASRIKGKQGADWQQRIVAGRGQLLQELAQLEALPMAQKLFDLPLLRQHLHAGNHPWQQFHVLRLIAAGDFLRRASAPATASSMPVAGR